MTESARPLAAWLAAPGLGAALALAAGLACAQAEVPPEEQPAAVPETTLEGIVIEAEPLRLERTIEELMQSFREALRRDRFDAAPVARPLGSDMMELNTRYGRFCVVSLPTQFGSDLARGIELANRCAAY
jgi:hypothetical protein